MERLNASLEERRGFDSLVQMSSGIAAEGMRRAGHDAPLPLPIQALDHATGYLIAAAVLRSLRQRNLNGSVLSARLSLARTTQLLISAGVSEPVDDLAPETAQDLAPETEQTRWGAAERLRFPAKFDGEGPSWPHPAGRLRQDLACW